jgi:acyl carrier protein
MKEDIRDYVCRDLLLDEDLQIEDDENLLVTGVLDSLALMRLVMHLEDTYEIDIPPSEITLENFASLTAMIEYLENRLGIWAA